MLATIASLWMNSSTIQHCVGFSNGSCRRKMVRSTVIRLTTADCSSDDKVVHSPVCGSRTICVAFASKDLYLHWLNACLLSHEKKKKSRKFNKRPGQFGIRSDRRLLAGAHWFIFRIVFLVTVAIIASRLIVMRFLCISDIVWCAETCHSQSR